MNFKDKAGKTYGFLFSALLWTVFAVYMIGGIKIGGKTRLTYLHDLWITCGLMYAIGRGAGLLKFRQTWFGRHFVAAMEALLDSARGLSFSPLKQMPGWSWIFITAILYSLGLFFFLPLLNYSAFGTEIFDFGVFMNSIHNKATTGAFHTWLMSPDGDQPLNYFPNAKVNYFLFVFAWIYKLIPHAQFYLFLQSLALLLAVIPLYKLADLILPREVPRWAPLVLFFFWDPIYRVNLWDIHEQPFMLGFSLWALYFIETRKLWRAVAFMLLMALWRDDGWWTFAGLAFYLGVRTRKWIIAVPLMIAGLAYLPIHLRFINQVNSIGQLYPYLGKDFSAAWVTISQKPWIFFEVMWENREFFTRVVLGLGGGIFLFSGWAIVPMLPVLMIVGLARHEGLLSWVNHYPLGFAGPAFFATLHGWARIHGWISGRYPRSEWRNTIIFCSLGICLTQLAFNLTGALSMGLQRYRDTRCHETLLERIPPKVPALAESVIAARITDREYLMRPSMDVDQTRGEVLVTVDKRLMKAGLKGRHVARPWVIEFENCGWFIAKRKPVP